MAVGVSNFDGEIALRRLCQELGLSGNKCEILGARIGEFCGTRTQKGKAKMPRKRSRWQECIAERRAGKKFDPQAIKELAKEYRAGRCPSG